jgi:uncharacterized protein (DUF302 family)
LGTAINLLIGVTVEEMTEYGYTVEVPEGYDEAVIRTRLAMRGEGFSVLTEAHVGGMLGSEAGSERQYLIYGVWNSQMASQDFGPGAKVAIHLPCNIVVQETGESAVVAALDPEDAVEMGGVDPVLAREARDALGRVLQKVGSAS